MSKRRHSVFQILSPVTMALMTMIAILTNLKILNDVFNNCKYKLLMNGTEFDTNEKCSKLISEGTSSMSTALRC